MTLPVGITVLEVVDEDIGIALDVSGLPVVVGGVVVTDGCKDVVPFDFVLYTVAELWVVVETG